MLKKLVAPTELQFDRQRLLEAAEKLVASFPFHPTYRQLSLVHRAHVHSMQERLYDGVGSLYDFEQGHYKAHPREFTVFNNELKDTYLFEIYQCVCQWSPLQIGRVRLMLRPPLSCYSMHADESARYHVVVKTNEDCYFFFKKAGVAHLPADGKLYHFNAELPHTGFNSGKTDRVHLVFDTIEWCKASC